MEHILVVDDEQSMLEFLEYLFRKQGYRVTKALEAATALQLLREQRGFDLVVSDLRMPDMDGLEFLKRCRAFNAEIPFIFITAFASSDTAIEALKHGAFDYITKPFQVNEIRDLVKRALETSEAKKKVLDSNAEGTHLALHPGKQELVGISPQMLEIYKLVGTIAPTESTVLITGETGTGKELVARAIHSSSPRKDGPFVSVNCGAFTETLLESELFGYTKGAFTGAVANKKGLFEAAEGGTLFLDEVGETSAAMQVKLLRSLQERRIRRVGGTEEIPVDARVIAATNRKLEEEIAQGHFREDLYYRLAVIPVHVPPLRSRPTDILPLVYHFIHLYNARLSRRVQGITEDALECMERYPWPGNVRELENVIERAVTLEQGDYVRKERLPEKLRDGDRVVGLDVSRQFGPEGLDLEALLVRIESDALLHALELSGGNQKRAADILKLTYRSFRHRMDRLQLRRVDDQDEGEGGEE